MPRKVERTPPKLQVVQLDDQVLPAPRHSRELAVQVVPRAFKVPPMTCFVVQQEVKLVPREATAVQRE
jgi:hypothetical protein